MPANFNDKVIIESNGAIKLNGNTGNNKQAMTSKGNNTPAWTDVVNSVSGGNAIGISGSTGDITINNEGVTSISAGSNITISGSTGNVTISATDQGGGGGGGGSSSVKLIKAGTGIKLTPGNGNLNNNDVTVATDLSGAGGCPQVKECYDSFFESDTSCQKVGRIYASALTLRSAGTENRPAIVMGIGKAPVDDTACYIGMTGGVNTRRVRIVGGCGWANGAVEDMEQHCGGGPRPDPEGGRSNLFTVQGGDPAQDGLDDDDEDKGKISINPDRKMQAPCMNEAATANSQPICMRSQKIVKFTNPNPYRAPGAPDPWDYFTAATDTNLANVDIESLFDTVAGAPSTDTTFEAGGLFRWARRSINSVKTLRYEDPTDFVPYPRFDLDALAAAHPYLVIRDYTDDSYYPEDYYDKEETDPNAPLFWRGQSQLKPVAERSYVITDVNRDAIQLISFLAHRRRKKQVANLASTLGIATTDENLGVFSGSVISDNLSVKEALQALETYLETDGATNAYVDQRFAELIEAAPNSLNTLNELAAALGDDADFASTVTTQIGTKLDASAISTFGLSLVDDADAATARTTLGLGDIATTSVSDYATAAQGATADAALPAAGAATALGVTSLIALTGVLADSTDLGGFTGTTISDNTTIKVALGQLETAVEARALATTVTEIDTDVADLVTLSGVAENASDLGAFTGTTITDNTTVKIALQEIETALEAAGAATAAPVLIEVHNASGGTLNKGTPVYVSGTHASGIPLVESADANGTSTYPVIGLIHTDLTTGNAGFVVISGLLNGLDTDSAGWNAGDALYLSETAGELVTTRPTANGTKVQKVALVTRRDATAGSIVVMGAGRTNDVPNELTTLLGTTLNDSDLGTFTGSIVTDNTSVKTAIQELETEIETKADLDGANIPGAFNNDTEAASNGVPVNGIYRNSNGTVHWRVS